MLAERFCDNLVGWPEEEVVKKLKEEGIPYRFSKIDDNAMLGTADFRMDRINLEVSSGKVIRAYRG